MILGFVILGCIVLLLALLVVMVVRSVKSASISKFERTQGVVAKRKLKHVDGLPISKKSSCSVMVTDSKLIFKSGGSEFVIMGDQVNAIEVITDVEIQNTVNSSLTQGIVGGLVFGPIGAVIGARAKNKRSKRYEHFLVINYITSNGDISAILLSSGNMSFAADKIKRKSKHLVVQSSNNVQL